MQADSARFGLFTDQALKLGISGSQTEQATREVKSSPEGQIADGTRIILVKQVRAERNVSFLAAYL